MAWWATAVLSQGTVVAAAPAHPSGPASGIAARTPQPAAAAPAPEIAGADYARPHRMVDIGGRRLNLFCLGSGSPTVVFEAGSGEAAWDWFKVQPQVAKRTRACSYDRAGLGFSDAAGPRAATSRHALDDLQALLKAAALAPPYVLVAHSYGALPAQMFAYEQPRQVAGIVLVDGHHEDEFTRIDAITKGRYAAMRRVLGEGGERCLAAARAGFVPGTTAAQECIGRPPDGAGRELSAAVRAQFLSPVYWQASGAEYADLFDASSDALRAMRRPFGDLPIVCLVRGMSPYRIPGQPQSALNKAVERDNEAVQAEVCALSTRGASRIVQGAGHAIHLDRPQAVIAAIDEVLDAAAGTTPGASR